MQADFVSSTCKVCGMIFARGEEVDEKLHTKFHSAFLRGPVLQVKPDFEVLCY